MGVFQVPPGAVIARRKTVAYREVAAEHLAAPPAFEANHEVPAVGSVDRNSRCLAFGHFGRLPKSGKGAMNGRYKVRKSARRDLVVRDVAANNLSDEIGVDRLSF